MSKTESVDFLHEISQFIFYSKYAQFNDTYKRRETWEECVNRVLRMHLIKYKTLPEKDRDEIKKAFQFVKDKKVVPSMRSMQFGGKAIMSHESKGYNCSMRHIDSVRAFSEVMYLLLCGCGVGFSISKQFINRLPDLVNSNDKTGSVVAYTVQDSIEGWADSVEALLNCYFKNTAYSGRKIVFDYSKIRPEGSPIKTGGGKAPGYKGLKNTHKKIKQLLDYIIEEENVTTLRPIHAYDILMHESDAVLSGGVRRSATIAVFDADDEEMMNAKTYFSILKHSRFSQDETTQKWEGRVTLHNKRVYDVTLSQYEYDMLLDKMKIGWNHIEPQRARSNNSILLQRKEITRKQFKEVVTRTKMFGEPGFIFSNDPRQVINPCGEVATIPITVDGRCGVQNCNLTNINGSRIKTAQDFYDACWAAALIGTLQAGYTDFKYLNKAAKEVTEGEALLGVGIAGMMENPDVILDPSTQQEGAKVVVNTNRTWAKKLGIKQAARTTLVKPDGNSSQALGSAPGIHPHHARRYFRRVQCNKQEAVFQWFKEHNPHMCEEGVWSANKTDEVVTFPVTVSDSAMIKADLTAIEHLKIIKSTQLNWVIPGTTEANKLPITHSVSCTVIVKDEEWDDVIDFLYDNRQYFSTVSLLPHYGDKLYKQAPYEAVTTSEDEVYWKKLTENYKPVNYKELHEDEDNTKLMAEMGCAGGACEVL